MRPEYTGPLATIGCALALLVLNTVASYWFRLYFDLGSRLRLRPWKAVAVAAAVAIACVVWYLKAYRGDVWERQALLLIPQVFFVGWVPMLVGFIDAPRFQQWFLNIPFWLAGLGGCAALDIAVGGPPHTLGTTTAYAVFMAMGVVATRARLLDEPVLVLVALMGWTAGALAPLALNTVHAPFIAVMFAAMVFVASSLTETRRKIFRLPF